MYVKLSNRIESTNSNYTHCIETSSASKIAAADIASR